MSWIEGLEYVVIGLFALYMLICLLAMTVLATDNSASAKPSMAIAGPLTKINTAEAFIVVNEKRVYFSCPPGSASVPRCSIRVESLKENQWVYVELKQGPGRLWVTSLMPINRPTGNGHGTSENCVR